MARSFDSLCLELGLRARGGDAELSALTHDSRAVEPGHLFVACPGATPTSADGHDYLAQALERGASALVVERIAAEPPVPYAVVDDARLALAQLAEAMAGHPSARLRLVGVTGTNGKTTVVHMCAAVLEACGLSCAELGTLGIQTSRGKQRWSHTTPEAPALSRTLAALVDEGLAAAALEVSSHALALRRVDGLRFAAAAFTNLSQDHLDFHGDMERYLEAKQRLFFELLPEDGARRAVICVDDAAGATLASALGPHALRVGIGEVEGLDLRADRASYSADGTRATLLVEGERHELRSRHTGAFNLQNALCALGLAEVLGLDLDRALSGLARCTPAPGRLERVSAADQPAVYVDYSHTPQALERALATLDEMTAGRLLVIFGCGGERDALKRGLMGAVAAAGADLVFITDDNPRGEDGDQIAAAIEAGARAVVSPRARQIEVERDRRAAIAAALAAAGPADAVLIAGKGHEEVQQVGAEQRAFSDRAVAQELLQGRAR